MTDHRNRRRTSAAAVAAAAAVLGLLPASPVGATHVQARGTADACSSAPEDGFTDTTAGTPQEEAIDCVVWYGIAQGTGGGRYSPAEPISRGQMATFIAASMRTSEKEFAEPTAAEDVFGDDEDSIHEPNINFVAKHEVVRGFGDGHYHPNRCADARHEKCGLVTRAQMATFIVNQLRAIGAPIPTPSRDFFPDDDTSPHQSNINILAELGIATGRTHDSYDPISEVRRDQMALFVARDLDYLVDEGLMVRPDQREMRITLDKTSLRAGEDLTGEITSEKSFSSVTLSGCGFSDEPVEDRETAVAGIQFSERIPLTQPSGDCELTFSATFTDASAAQATLTITVTGVNEAAAGAHTSVDVKSVDRTSDSFVGQTDAQGHPEETFFFDTNDKFQFRTTAITAAEFKNLLTGAVGDTAGDVLDVDYATEPSGVSTFNVTTDNVPPPANAVASVLDADGDGAADDVTITWAASAQPDAVYDVFRDEPLTDNGAIGIEDAQVATNTAAVSVTVTNQPNGTYNYLVRAEGGTSASLSVVVGSNNVTVPGQVAAQQQCHAAGTDIAPPPAGAPRSDNLRQTTRSGEATVADAGDVLCFAFDKQLATLAAGDEIRLVEGIDPVQSGPEESTTARNGSNATFTLNTAAVTINGITYAPGQVLQVRLDAKLLPQTIGGDGTINYPLTVQTSVGLTGTGGSPVDWSNSFDRTVEADTAAPRSTSTVVSEDADGKVSAGDTIGVTFDETLAPRPEQPYPDAVTIKDSAGDTVTLTHGSNATFAPSGNTLTITVGSGVAATPEVDYGTGTLVTAHVYVTDLAGNGWDLANSTDRAVDRADVGRPQMLSVVGSTNTTDPDTITITYSEAVRCNNTIAAAAQFTYDENPVSGGDEHVPTVIACNDSETVVLTFGDGVFKPGLGTDVLRYVESALEVNRIEDLAGNDAVSPDSKPVDG